MRIVSIAEVRALPSSFSRWTSTYNARVPRSRGNVFCGFGSSRGAAALLELVSMRAVHQRSCQGGRAGAQRMLQPAKRPAHPFASATAVHPVKRCDEKRVQLRTVSGRRIERTHERGQTVDRRRSIHERRRRKQPPCSYKKAPRAEGLTRRIICRNAISTMELSLTRNFSAIRRSSTEMSAAIFTVNR